jgi:hypothetical protein
METKKGSIVSIQTKVKNDGSGEYYIVKMKDADGHALPDHLCFNGKIKDIAVGAMFEYISNEKNNTWFLNLPREDTKKTYAGAGGGYRGKSELEIKLNAILQLHTMPMSYAKDVVVGCQISNPADAGSALISLYKRLHNEIISSPEIKKLLNLTGKEISDSHTETEGNEPEPASTTFGKTVTSFLTDLKSIGWVLPSDIKDQMLKRLTGELRTATDGTKTFTAGLADTKEMSTGMAMKGMERFYTFTKECPGNPTGCRYYKAKGLENADWCAWISKCIYLTNADERFGE